MITLYGFGAKLSQPDLSPFVMKALILLRMSRLPFDIKTGLAGVRNAPKGKLPYIGDKGKFIPDTRLIRLYLEQEYGVDFSGGYPPDILAIGHAVERMQEESSYFVSVHRRWLRPDGWAKTKEAIFGELPAAVQFLIGPIAQRRVRAMLHGQGTGRLSEEEMDMIAVQNLKALSAVLGDKPYILGDRPCGSDATVLAFLISGSAAAFPGKIRDGILGAPNLVAYRDRLAKQFMPEFDAVRA